MPTLSQAVRLAASLVHRTHIAYEFPLAVLEARRRNLPALDPAYEVRRPLRREDADAFASLLAEEPSFGVWTGARVSNELLNHLAHPMAATLVLHKGKPVACGCVVDASTRRAKVAHGMFLYVTPSERGRGQLANYVTWSTLGYCLDAGYDKVVGYTDPHRLSALLLYLSDGARPIHDCLTSFWRWHRVQRRLAPALQRLTRVRTRSQGAAKGGDRVAL